ncbi:MAG: anaerobic sulfatase-maturation protein [Prevotella sp.]|nr:anaerobic sulfatase-maturation protein [Prevotella sp.]
MTTATPFARPFYVMAKPAGSRCNLSCRYCYYLEKRKMYDETGGFCMSDALLENFIRQYIEAQTAAEVLFTWHGGEPLLRPLAFYERALALQRRYAGGRHIDNCIQTNGTLIDDEWCRFFRDNGFLVGVSVDGPRRFHDPMRGGSFDSVMRGIGLLEKHGVEWNAMAVVNSLNVGSPLEFYSFFKSIGCRYLQFTPVVERRDASRSLMPGLSEGGMLTNTSVSPEQWGAFLCTLFDEWVRHDVGKIFVQLFDATLANWAGVPPGICSLAPVCGHSSAMEYNGDLYSCDHFVFPEYRLGNILTDTITSMMYGARQTAFGNAKRAMLPRQCRECEFLFACNGECPKNRFVRDRYGNPGLNWLCAGYHRFFTHAAPYMDYMKAELDAGRAPANIMERIEEGPL